MSARARKEKSLSLAQIQTDRGAIARFPTSESRPVLEFPFDAPATNKVSLGLSAARSWRGMKRVTFQGSGRPNAYQAASSMALCGELGIHFGRPAGTIRRQRCPTSSAEPKLKGQLPGSNNHAGH
jgi:hypothetical protein